MGFDKRRVSTTIKVTVANFEEVKAQFLLNVNVTVEMDEIPPALIINLDQTGIHYVPAGSWKMEKEGTKRVEIIAADNKRKIIQLFMQGLYVMIFTTTAHLQRYDTSLPTNCGVS